MASVSERVALFGTDEPLPESRVLKAGPVTVELENGALRYVRYRGREAVRGVAYLVRDAHWGTPVPEISNLEVREEGGGFRVRYDARCTMGDQVYAYRAEITSAADGTLVFEVVGRGVTDVITNRTGFIVLHPLAGVAGETVEVTHTDGTTEKARFPRLVRPAQPLFDIRALRHEVMPGVFATCTMEGDAFEMEDQRNWSDASFKTYVRPLARPKPFTIRAGEEVIQRVTLAFEGAPAAPVQMPGGPVQIRVGEEEGRMPEIGLWVPPDEAEASLEVADDLKALGPNLLVGTLDLRDEESAARLRPLHALADALQAPVTLEIILPNRSPPADELSAAARLAAAAGLAPDAVVPSPHAYLKSYQPDGVWPDVPPLEEIYRATRAAFTGARVGGGMLSYFTELNRKRPPAAEIDFVTHSTCPLVHDADDRAVMDTLEALPWIALSVRAFAPGKPYRVGPSMLGMRQNPYGAAPARNPQNQRIVLAWNDPRQRGIFGAAWSLGYIAHFARAGVEALTLSAPVGAFGVTYRRSDFSQPYFDEQGRGVYPLYHVLRSVARGAGKPRLACTISDGAAVQALAWQEDAGVVLWLANLQGSACQVELPWSEDDAADVARLNATTFRAAASGAQGLNKTTRREPAGALQLAAYEVACIRTQRQARSVL